MQCIYYNFYFTMYYKKYIYQYVYLFLFFNTSLCVKDDEEMVGLRPPTPPPRKFTRGATASFRLPCIGKRDSHERPMLVRQSSSIHSCSDLRGSSTEDPPEVAARPNSGEPCAMRHIAASLCFAHLPAMAVAGVQPSTDQWKKRRRLGDGSSHIPTHRASYHGIYLLLIQIRIYNVIN